MVEKPRFLFNGKRDFLRIFVCILDDMKKYDFFKNMC